MSRESEKQRVEGAHAAYGAAIERHKQLSSSTATRPDGLGIKDPLAAVGDPLERAMTLHPRPDGRPGDSGQIGRLEDDK